MYDLRTVQGKIIILETNKTVFLINKTTHHFSQIFLINIFNFKIYIYIVTVITVNVNICFSFTEMFGFAFTIIHIMYDTQLAYSFIDDGTRFCGINNEYN